MRVSSHSLAAEAAHHAVITGASSGIGAALAVALAGNERRLTLFARNVERLEGVAEQCRARGAKVVAKAVDVTCAEGMAVALREADDLRPVSLVIANAGIGGAGALAGSDGEPADTARNILTVNVIGVVNTLSPLLPRMIARGRGHLAIIGSLAGYLGLPQAPAYCASKAAARVYGEALRRQLKPKGIGVTVACPGFVATPMSASLAMPLPYVWTAERAVQRIVGAIASNQAEVAFPWQLNLAIRAVSVLPRALSDLLIAQLGRRELSA